MSIPPSVRLDVGLGQGSSDGMLVTRSGRRVARKSFPRNDTFPFLKLPSEIRNMIYRIALAQGATSKACTHHVGSIGIENTKLRSHRSRTISTRRRLRSSYRTTSSAFCYNCEEYHDRVFITATYSLPIIQKIPALGFLAVNRQIRFEAVPIFFGENMFKFYDIGTVVPFLKDCSHFSREQIRCIGLHFDVTTHRDSIHDYQIDERAKAFAYIGRWLKLSKLHLVVSDTTYRFEEPLTSFVRDEEWIRAATQIHDLDGIDFYLRFDGIEGYCESFLDSWPTGPGLSHDEAMDKADEVMGWMLETREGYHDYLNSKMLKKKQTMLDGWLNRHVCRVHCKDIEKGRAAAKVGLPRTDTHGEWTLPDVDLDALYADFELESKNDESDIEDWSDDDGEATESDDGTAVKGELTSQRPEVSYAEVKSLVSTGTH
ncbi:MAG: hypothetical protein Q9169_006060 [Polycauliona sp. 2 TL-2023]